jgi:hypothetical protein
MPLRCDMSTLFQIDGANTGAGEHAQHASNPVYNAVATALWLRGNTKDREIGLSVATLHFSVASA